MVENLVTALGLTLALVPPVLGQESRGTMTTEMTYQPAPVTQPTATTKPGVDESPVAIPGLHNEQATYLIDNRWLYDDSTILWKGFLNGLRGFEQFYEPIGNPIYFESPFNNSELRLLYIYHHFSSDSQIGGGHLNVAAAQIRVALTERLAFIATKDGYSWMDAGILPEASGWNDAAVGLKYVFIADRENAFLLAGGMRWEWENGDRDVLQGQSQELSPFISAAKGFDRLHFIGDVTGRLPMDHNDASYIVMWDLHVDYEIAPKLLPGLAPLFEVHGLHYLSDGTSLPLSVGGLDYTNIGSMSVSGNSVYWAGIGARWKLTPHASIGADYEFPLCNDGGDLMGDRVTVDFRLTW